MPIYWKELTFDPGSTDPTHRHVRRQRPAQHLQAALVHHRHEPHRGRRVLPICRRAAAACRRRLPRARRARRIPRQARMGSVADWHQPAPRSARGVPRRHRARNLRAFGGPAIGMALLDPPRLRRAIARGRGVPASDASRVRADRRRRRSKRTSRPSSSSTSASTSRGRPPTWASARPPKFAICVTANDGFFALLKAAVQGEDIDGKPLLPVALEGLDDAKTCQILYVGDAQSAGRARRGSPRCAARRC